MDHIPSKPEAKELIINGRCSYALQSSGVLLSVQEIMSLRPVDNLSGTLVLELWALHMPFNGGSFSGYALAATTLGCLFGQNVYQELNLSCEFTEPPAGTWTICLMLREWDGEGYVTKDYVNFDIGYVVDPVSSKSDTSNLIAVDMNAPVQAATQDDPEPISEPKSEAIPDVPASALIQAKKSINQVSLKDLTVIKGINQKTKLNILAGQPYQNWQDLLNVKGVGSKILTSLDSHFTL